MTTIPSVIDVPWIGAVDLHGAWRRVSAREILAAPHTWGCLHESYPTRTAAAWRLLMALYLASDGDIDRYGKEWADRLALGGVDVPFGQTVQLRDTLDHKRSKGEGRLVELDPRRAKGNAPLLWDHTRSDQDPPYTAAEAVAAMLITAVAGSAGMGTGLVHPTPPDKDKKEKEKSYRTLPKSPLLTGAAVLPYAATIADVLDATADHFGPFEGDRPSWEWEPGRFAPVTAKTIRTPAGPLEWLTWPTRAVLLGWNGDQPTAAVSTPGWETPNDWPRDRVDPLAIPSGNPKRPGSVIGPLSVHRAAREIRDGTLALPPHLQQLREHGPLRLRLLGQPMSNNTQINGHIIAEATCTPNDGQEDNQ